MSPPLAGFKKEERRYIGVHSLASLEMLGGCTIGRLKYSAWHIESLYFMIVLNSLIDLCF